MAYDWETTAGDMLPELAHTLSDETGAAYDLTGATVRIIARNPERYGTKIDAAATIVSAAEGEVRYSPVAEDSDTPGLYYWQWKVTLSDGRSVTVPNSGYYTLHVMPSLYGLGDDDVAAAVSPGRFGGRWGIDITADSYAADSTGVSYADDAIAAAIADAALGVQGGQVCLPPGEYRIQRPITIRQRGITLRGAGRSPAKIQSQGFNGPTVAIYHPDNVVPRGAPLCSNATYSFDFTNLSQTRYVDMREVADAWLHGWATLTWECYAWFDPAAVDESRWVFGSFGRQFSSSSATVAFEVVRGSGGTLAIRWTTSGSGTRLAQSSAGAVPTGQVLHLSFTYNGTTGVARVNGVTVASNTATGTIVQNPWEVYSWGGPRASRIGFGGVDAPACAARIDSIRLTQSARYSADFSPTGAKHVADSTLCKYTCNADDMTTDGLIKSQTPGVACYQPPIRTDVMTDMTDVSVRDLWLSGSGPWGVSGGIYAASAANICVTSLRLDVVRYGLYLINNCYLAHGDDIVINGPSTSPLPGNPYFGIGLFLATGVVGFSNAKINSHLYPVVTFYSSGVFENVYATGFTDQAFFLYGGGGEQTEQFDIISGFPTDESSPTHPESVIVADNVAMVNVHGSVLESTQNTAHSSTANIITCDSNAHVTLNGVTLGPVSTMGQVVRVLDAGSRVQPAVTVSGGYRHRANAQVPWVANANERPFVRVLSLLAGSRSTTISDASTSAAITLAVAEADAHYKIGWSIGVAGGTPAAGALHPSFTSKTSSGFTIQLEAAPGSGNSVTVDWSVYR